MTLAMIPTYGRVLSAIEEALRELVAEYRGVGKSLRDLVEGQERNTAQLERIGAAMERRWGRKERAERRAEMKRRGLRMAPEKVRRGGLRRPPPVRLVVLFFPFSIEFLFSVN